ncbi:hypothetical protein [Pseudomonas sp. zfem002]|uniref:hypothetical protein n=1 Tax=Pseudomonas sp. zfem002 TaxID=3078197 RepID=UPI0029295ABC|nr:hypothetical protein [Pseudomonas sp. zfem002]MDU9394745.1 hypothetical protein [Pseudomonas sp. zfem002]
MSAEAKLTGDLFEVDKRLSLKPVVDFNTYLSNAFGDGRCACARCQESGNDESAYAFAHTFEFNGIPLNRRFAITTAADVLAKLKSAWLSYNKEEMPGNGTLDLQAIKTFVEPSLQVRVKPLLLASGLAREVEGGLQLMVEGDFA